MVRASLSTSTGVRAGPARAGRSAVVGGLALPHAPRPRRVARVHVCTSPPHSPRKSNAQTHPWSRRTYTWPAWINLDRSPLTSRHSRSDRQLDNWQPTATGVFNRDPSRIRSPSKSRSRLTTTARESAPTSLTIARLCRSEPWLMWGEQAQYTPLCGCGVQAGCGAKKVRAKVA